MENYATNAFHCQAANMVFVIQVLNAIATKVGMAFSAQNVSNVPVTLTCMVYFNDELIKPVSHPVQCIVITILQT